MAIIAVPKPTDSKGKCSRWRVILYNRFSHKQEWHTIDGGKREAEDFEREQKRKLSRGTYVAKAERMTLQEVAEAFLKECKARNRRTSTLINYGSILDGYILKQFGPREVGTLQKKEVRGWLSDLMEAGTSTELVNRIIRVLKTVLFYAVTDLEVLDRNILLRFKQYEGSNPKATNARKMRRGAYSEEEVRAMIDCARPHERALIGLLCFTGIRPGECFALRRRDLDLVAGAARIERNWDARGKVFTEPKTEAGKRTVALSGWLVTELTAHLGRTAGGPDELVFATKTGNPLHPSNVRRDIWSKLVKRAGVRELDMYSLRHTFATFGRAAGEAAFNVSRSMGHSRSTLVDQVYAHSLQSGMASVAERVTQRALGEKPQLRVVADNSERDVRQPLDSSQSGAAGASASG